MTDGLRVFVARVDTPEGRRDLVTLLPPSGSFEQGLVPEAIVGSLLRPLGPHEAVTPDNFARNPVFVEFLHQVALYHRPADSHAGR